MSLRASSAPHTVPKECHVVKATVKTLCGLFRRNAKTQHRKCKVRDGDVLVHGDRKNPAGGLERARPGVDSQLRSQEPGKGFPGIPLISCKC